MSSPVGPDDNVLILASGSPRRAEILGEVGVRIEIVPAVIDEDTILSGAHDFANAVQRLALVKAQSVAAYRPGRVVLGADTIVVLDGEILGKPGSPDRATEMLQRLNDRSHEVITGIAVINSAGESHTDFVRTSVRFRRLGDDKISNYVSTGSPLDKAGGYGIQDSSFAPVASYDGCYLNVVGLPMCVTSRLIEKAGLPRIDADVCRGHAGFDAASPRVGE